MYRVTCDEANHRLVLELIGSYTDIDPAALDRELRAAALKVKRASHFDLLVDLTQITVMPQQIAAIAGEGMAWCFANGLRRSATVMNSVLAKMQVERLSGSDTDSFRTFTSRADALAWLGATR